jgi:hypothetical protein
MVGVDEVDVVLEQDVRWVFGEMVGCDVRFLVDRRSFQR